MQAEKSWDQLDIAAMPKIGMKNIQEVMLDIMKQMDACGSVGVWALRRELADDIGGHLLHV